MVKHFDPDTVGVLYFITSHEQDACKIGFATDMYQRLKTLQTGNPDTLELRMEIPATLGAEMELHKFLAPRRIRLEWFWDRSDFLICLEQHLDLFVQNKDDDEAYLTAKDVREQFPEFMAWEGHRYPDENDPHLLAEIASYRTQ